MTAVLIKDIRINKIIYWIENWSYEQLNVEIIHEIKELINIKAGVVEEAVYGDIDDLSQIGIKIGAPPIPNAAPAIPAINPIINNLNIFFLLN